MKTFAEILKDAGVAEDKIATLVADAKLTATVESMVADAETRLAQADKKVKDLNEFWNNKATPEINKAYSEKAQAEAEAAFYRKQAEDAKASGFILKDAPTYDASKRNADGTFKPGANEVPGSPAVVSRDEFNTVAGRTVDAFYETQDVSNEYAHLFGQPLLNVKNLVAEAKSAGKGFRQHVEDKFGFQKKRDELVAAKQKEHDDAIRKEAEANVRKEYAEKFGSNPDLRVPVTSGFSKFKKTEQGGMDRLAWAKADKRQVHESLKQEAMKEIIH